jgi:hypothetical protein
MEFRLAAPARRNNDLTELVKTHTQQFQAMSDSGYSGSDDEAMRDAENLSEYDFSDECLGACESGRQNLQFKY